LIGVVGTIGVALINRPVSPASVPEPTVATLLQVITAAPSDTPRPAPEASPTQAPSPTTAPTKPPSATPKPTETPEPTPEPESTAATSNKVGACGNTRTVRGWTQYENLAEKFKLAIPVSWSCTEFDPATMDQSLETASQIYSGAGEVFASDAMRQMVIQGLKLAAYDFESVSGDNAFPVNITVFVEKLPIKMTLRNYTTLAVANIKKLYGDDVVNESTTTELNGTEVSRLKVTLPFGGATINRVLYVFLRENRAYLLALEVPVNMADTYEPTFEDVAQTFELIE
jgi:hypothetical protein